MCMLCVFLFIQIKHRAYIEESNHVKKPIHSFTLWNFQLGRNGDVRMETYLEMKVDVRNTAGNVFSVLWDILLIQRTIIPQ